MLQETKQGYQEMRGIIDRLKQYDGSIYESRGASGGIATLWNHTAWKHQTDTINQFWIKVNLEGCGSDHHSY